ncbi:helix-turn-helix domain-containing protein [Flavonifractor sp. An52]|uniref:helix-turn-helix domain-containing protein n=1 Tax=Flavonifractor sp. An52 TaxID=1965642 RepID=UPI001FA897EE|nr:helix-turn-helix transcriptional regulator [Flavonifractor sp. An52]
MPHDKRNIYKIAREARGLTQEAAAEKLGISDSSIRAYETGQRIPPLDVVDLMVDAMTANCWAFSTSGPARRWRDPLCPMCRNSVYQPQSQIFWTVSIVLSITIGIEVCSTSEKMT